jgi:bifunctional non-homologous end joining protein LigD
MRDMPRFIEPMLASSGAVPEGDDWALEVKFDGIRAQLRWDGRSLSLRSRPGRDCTSEFPELGAIGGALGRRRATLDGELVCFAEGGNPDFERREAGLARTVSQPSGLQSGCLPPSWLRPAPSRQSLDPRTALRATRAAPGKALELAGPAWQTPRNFLAQADAPLVSTAERGLEGVVAKRLDGPYKPGTRNGAWVKHKHPRSGAFLITAWAPTQPSRARELLPRQAARALRTVYANTA